MGRQFGLSLTLHHRLPGMCISCCIRDCLPIVQFAGVCVAPVSHSPVYCFAVILVLFLCSDLGLGHLFIASCLPWGRDQPLTGDEPILFPWYLLSCSCCVEEAAPARAETCLPLSSRAVCGGRLQCQACSLHKSRVLKGVCHPQK